MWGDQQFRPSTHTANGIRRIAQGHQACPVMVAFSFRQFPAPWPFNIWTALLLAARPILICRSARSDDRLRSSVLGRKCFPAALGNDVPCRSPNALDVLHANQVRDFGPGN